MVIYACIYNYPVRMKIVPGTNQARASDDMLNYNNPIYTLSYYISNISLHFWDAWCGTDFSHIDKTVESKNRSPYYATPWISLVFLDRFIKRNLSDGKGYSVLDVGCGKGFMLYIFSQKGFKKVAGIEYDKRLKRIAYQNLKKLCKSKKEIPTIYNGNAALFRSWHQYDVFYLYNPFDRNTLKRVVIRIMKSTKEHPRGIFLFYCNPLYDDVLIKFGWKKVAQFYYKTRVYYYKGDL